MNLAAIDWLIDCRGIEAQIIDYQTQQYKLFPMVATAYAMHFTGQFIQRYYTKISDEIEAGNLESFSVVSSSV